jgi:hypothetical protein
MEEDGKKAGDLAHQPARNSAKWCCENWARILMRCSLRRELEWRKMRRRLVIWHTTQLEILQDDGAKTGQEFS